MKQNYHPTTYGLHFQYVVLPYSSTFLSNLDSASYIHFGYLIHSFMIDLAFCFDAKTLKVEQMWICAYL